MEDKETEVISYIKENDVKFIKLYFTDIFGKTRSISIQPEEINRAITEGIEFNGSEDVGFLSYKEGDLYIVPDLRTLSILPWRPQHGRVARLYCNILDSNGAPFAGDSRAILSRVVGDMGNIDIECNIRTDFCLYKLDDNGKPTATPHDSAGLCHLAPEDKGENVRRAICNTLRELGIVPRSSRHKERPGQHEVDYRSTAPLGAADDYITFKNVVESIAAINGLYAKFTDKICVSSRWILDCPNLTHVNFNFTSNEHRSSFIAGIQSRLGAILRIISPNVTDVLHDTYPDIIESLPEEKIGYTQDSVLRKIDKSGIFRLELNIGVGEYNINPYLTLALLLKAGLLGTKGETNGLSTKKFVTSVIPQEVLVIMGIRGLE